MKTMTATEASRHFSDLLDAVERGETITIITAATTRSPRSAPPIAAPALILRAALADVPPPDDGFGQAIAEAVAMVTSEVRDPWAGA